jgi:CheY-like chemotaxis protein
MSTAGSANTPTRILLVEDDNHIGRIIELSLPELGTPYTFTSVLSAEEGLELWQREPFDLLITDYNLRGLTGLQMVMQLQAQGITVPTLLVTAYDSPEVRREARALGVNSYLSKPFFMDELITAVRELLPLMVREVNGA